MDVNCTLYIALHNVDNGIIIREVRILQITSLLDHVHNNNTDVTPLSDTSKAFS